MTLLIWGIGKEGRWGSPKFVRRQFLFIPFHLRKFIMKSDFSRLGSPIMPLIIIYNNILDFEPILWIWKILPLFSWFFFELPNKEVIIAEIRSRSLQSIAWCKRLFLYGQTVLNCIRIWHLFGRRLYIGVLEDGALLNDVSVGNKLVRG